MSHIGYVLGGYGLVLGTFASYAAWTITRGRKLSRRLPEEQRRWM